MANDEFFYEMKDSQYGEGILVDEYNGRWSLVSARRKNDTTYMDWAFPQSRDGNKKPLDKAVPWKITFGSKEDMIGTLRNILKQLSGNADDTDAPF